MQQKQSSLKQKAIKSAIQQNWEEAENLNLAILEENPKDLEALNRLGLAQMQLKKIKEAKKNFNKVLEYDKSNIIANKNLTKIKNNQTNTGLSFSANCHFIEEPGKTKIIELHRLAGKQVLDDLQIGQPCVFSIKNRYISINCDGKYVGALPDDISFRLTKLVKSGNEYSCSVHSSNSKKCFVHIKEVKSTKENANIQSFPISKNCMSSYSTVDDDVILEDFIPVASEDDEVDFPVFDGGLSNLDQQEED